MDILPQSPAPFDPKRHTLSEVSSEESTVLGLSFAWELGYTIALPAIVFCVGGAKLDRYMNSGHTFFFLGLIIAFILSFWGAYRKIRFIMRRMPKDLPRKPRPSESPIDPETAKEQVDLHELFRPPTP